jgi:hypothetical protein
MTMLFGFAFLNKISLRKNKPKTLCITAALQYNVPRFTNDAMDVITDPEVDAVWICSPSSFHAEQIKACAANGKHVFCEKPIATDLPETVEAINACNEAGVKLMIGLQRRFDQNFMRVKNAVVEKEVGESIMVRTFATSICPVRLPVSPTAHICMYIMYTDMKLTPWFGCVRTRNVDWMFLFFLYFAICILDQIVLS